MSSKKTQNKKSKDSKNKNLLLVILALVLAVAAYTTVNNSAKQQASTAEPGKPPVAEASGGSSGTQDKLDIPTDTDIKILKSDITEEAKFYPYKAGDTYMEVLAVKATDGSIRTALNTCQVCFDSGRGYYEQQGNKLICQNCGNVFGVDDVEIVKGGCNPVPVLKENKSEDGEFITISKDFMAANKDLFAEWKR